MAKTEKTGGSGLLTGFLCGSAVCLFASAGASYLMPLPGTMLETAAVADTSPAEADTKAAKKEVPAPKVEDETVATPLNPVFDLNITTPEVEAPTPESRVSSVATPSPEDPAADRDSDIVAKDDQSGLSEVQIGSPKEPEGQNPVDEAPKTVNAEEVASQPAPQTLSLAEDVPSSDVPSVDPGAVDQPAQKPEASLEVVDLPEPSAEAEAVIASNPVSKAAASTPDTALPKPEGSETANASTPKVEAPSVGPQVAEDTGAVALPRAPAIPKTDSVLALNTAPRPDAVLPIQKNPDPKEPAEPRIVFLEPIQEPEKVEAVPEVEAEKTPQPVVAEEAKPVPEVVAEPATTPEPEVVAEAKPKEATSTAEPKADPEPQPVLTPSAPAFSGPAFEAFAVDFPPNYVKPYLTIILEHVGEGSVDMYDLLNFASPITFAVSSEDDRAAWRENEFRKAGFEVVVLVPDDPEIGLSLDMPVEAVSGRVNDYLDAVPGAVAVLDQVESELYKDAKLIGALSNELSVSGRGLLVHEKFGVNRAVATAQSSGIPAASLLRVIDENRDSSSIRRALDRAALDASKTGTAIVMGHTYPETMAAILPWLLGNTARSIRLAPLTATMNRMDNR